MQPGSAKVVRLSGAQATVLHTQPSNGHLSTSVQTAADSAFPAPASRWRALAFTEAFAFSAFVALYIWRLQLTERQTWWIFPVWLVASFLAYRDTPKTLGWRGDNLWLASRRAAPFFALGIVALCVTGVLLGGLRRFPTHLFELRRFGGYAAFCLLQQVALNSFLTNRLLTALRNPLGASLASGAIFAALHWPSPVLVPLTFVGGAAMAWLFASQRNILPLSLGQAILGALIWWAFPIAWHHGMRVGPGFYTFHPHYHSM